VIDKVQKLSLKFILLASNFLQDDGSRDWFILEGVHGHDDTLQIQYGAQDHPIVIRG
jgi:hypothetical protein